MKTICVGSIALLLAGCASVVSRPQLGVTKASSTQVDALPASATQAAADTSLQGTAVDDGLVYWMPQRDIIVSITLVGKDASDAGDTPAGNGKAAGQAGAALAGKPDPAPGNGKPSDAGQAQPPAPGSGPPAPGNGAPTKPATPPTKPATPADPAPPESPVIKIAGSPAFADTRQAYVAHFARNLIGKNQLTIEVNEKGLLSSAKSETTSDLSAIFTSLASTAGSLQAGLASSEEPANRCPKKLSRVLRVAISDPANAQDTEVKQLFPNPGYTCPIVVTVTRPTGLTALDNARATDGSHEHSGFFYRQNLPYRVKVTFGQWEAQDVVMLPNDSPVMFLPVERSLFANNASDLTFSDGVLTKYGQTVDGEIVAIAKLPADVLKAYFAAVGAAFTWRKDAATSETAYLEAMLALSKKQLAAERCLAAYETNDPTRIAKDCP